LITGADIAPETLYFENEPVLSRNAGENKKGRTQINLSDPDPLFYAKSCSFLVAGFGRRIFKSYLFLIYGSVAELH